MCRKMPRKSGNACRGGNRAVLQKAQCPAVQREGGFACFYFWKSSPESSFQMARDLKQTRAGTCPVCGCSSWVRRAECVPVCPVVTGKWPLKGAGQVRDSGVPGPLRSCVSDSGGWRPRDFQGGKRERFLKAGQWGNHVFMSMN